MTRHILLPSLLLAIVAMPTTAHHGGDDMDETMAEREAAFEPTDLLQVPQPDLSDADGNAFRLERLDDRVVVLSFAPEGCGAPCEDQQVLLQDVQAEVNDTLMRDQVVFLTVGAHDGDGWDETNWRALSGDDGKAADSFAALSERVPDAPMVHVIARDTRHAAILHGADFNSVNLIVYLNALTNASRQ